MCHVWTSTAGVYMFLSLISPFHVSSAVKKKKKKKRWCLQKDLSLFFFFLIGFQ